MGILKDDRERLDAFYRLVKTGPKAVQVGILADKAKQPKEQNNEITLLEVAILNEFGGVAPEGNTIPERSFIRAWVDENKEEIFQRLASEMVGAFNRGEDSLERALMRIGIWAQGKIQERISNRIPPPNAPYTIKKKGSDVPLIDTGQLRSAISWKVLGRRKK